MATKPSAISSKPQKTSGSQLRPSAKTKAAAKRAAGGSSAASFAGAATHTGGMGTAAQLQSGLSRNIQNANLSLPGGTPTVTPIAPPKVDPFLTPTDMSSEAVENGQWDDYVSGLLQQQQTNDADTGLTVGNIDRSLQQGLEQNDWSSAARGIQNSSIKDQNKAQMVTQAAASRGAETDKQTAFHNYVSGQQHQVDTVYKPAIGSKYAALAAQNAAAVSAQQTPDQSGAAAPAASPAASAPAFTAQTPGTVNPSQAPSTQQIHGSSSVTMPDSSGYQTIIKNGNVYHYYPSRPAGSQYVYVRPATH